jgi:hypothetical protein
MIAFNILIAVFLPVEHHLDRDEQIVEAGAWGTSINS